MINYDGIMCRYELTCDRCGAITKTKIMVKTPNNENDILEKYGYARMSPQNKRIICRRCLDEIND